MPLVTLIQHCSTTRTSCHNSSPTSRKQTSLHVRIRLAATAGQYHCAPPAAQNCHSHSCMTSHHTCFVMSPNCQHQKPSFLDAVSSLRCWSSSPSPAAAPGTPCITSTASRLTTTGATLARATAVACSSATQHCHSHCLLDRRPAMAGSYQWTWSDRQAARCCK